MRSRLIAPLPSDALGAPALPYRPPEQPRPLPPPAEARRQTPQGRPTPRAELRGHEAVTGLATDRSRPWGAGTARPRSHGEVPRESAEAQAPGRTRRTPTCPGPSRTAGGARARRGLPRCPQAATPGPPPGPGLRAGAAGRCLRQGGPGGPRCGGKRVPGKPRPAAEEPRLARSEVRGRRSARPRHGAVGRVRETRRPRAPRRGSPGARFPLRAPASASRKGRKSPASARRSEDSGSPRRPEVLPSAGPHPHPRTSGLTRLKGSTHAQSAPRRGGWRRRAWESAVVAAGAARGSGRRAGLSPGGSRNPLAPPQEPGRSPLRR